MNEAAVLVVNTGSTGVKVSVIGAGDELLAGTQVGPGDDLEHHIAAVAGSAAPVAAVAHRVVHGGPSLTGPVVVDDGVRRRLASVQHLDPLHLRSALAAIDVTRRLLPAVPSFACFDTGFHAGLPAEASVYAVPLEWLSRWGVRRYGFHGLSCAWACTRVPALLGRPDLPHRLVICHLGGGASATAVVDGRSVDTTMGFTPMEGLVMATRAGDLDAGAVLHALRQGLSVDEVEDTLERRSGLLGLSGASGDLRDLLRARDDGDPASALAVDVFVHRLRAKIAAMGAGAGGIDALVFTGGVGQHLPTIREETCRGLGWTGVDIDPDANRSATSDADISAPGAPVAVVVVEAREDLVMAHQARTALTAGAGAHHGGDGRPG